MGGWGSGAYGPMGSKVRKPTVGEVPHIHVQKVKDYLDVPGLLTYSWHDGKRIGVTMHGEYMKLLYKVNGVKVSTKVYIDSTKVGYGERLWFNCPFCGVRTARLYILGQHFKCRTCQNLTYVTCQASGDPLDYMAIKITRLQKRLGIKNPHIDDVPIYKPKNMHQETFDKLRLKLQWWQMKRNEAWIAGARKILMNSKV